MQFPCTADVAAGPQLCSLGRPDGCAAHGLAGPQACLKCHWECGRAASAHTPLRSDRLARAAGACYVSLGLPQGGPGPSQICELPDQGQLACMECDASRCQAEGATPKLWPQLTCRPCTLFPCLPPASCVPCTLSHSCLWRPVFPCTLFLSPSVGMQHPALPSACAHSAVPPCRRAWRRSALWAPAAPCSGHALRPTCPASEGQQLLAMTRPWTPSTPRWALQGLGGAWQATMPCITHSSAHSRSGMHNFESCCSAGRHRGANAALFCVSVAASEQHLPVTQPQAASTQRCGS